MKQKLENFIDLLLTNREALNLESWNLLIEGETQKDQEYSARMIWRIIVQNIFLESMDWLWEVMNQNSDNSFRRVSESAFKNWVLNGKEYDPSIEIVIDSYGMVDLLEKGHHQTQKEKLDYWAEILERWEERGGLSSLWLSDLSKIGVLNLFLEHIEDGNMLSIKHREMIKKIVMNTSDLKWVMSQHKNNPNHRNFQWIIAWQNVQEKLTKNFLRVMKEDGSSLLIHRWSVFFDFLEELRKEKIITFWLKEWHEKKAMTSLCNMSWEYNIQGMVPWIQTRFKDLNCNKEKFYMQSWWILVKKHGGGVCSKEDWIEHLKDLDLWVRSFEFKKESKFKKIIRYLSEKWYPENKEESEATLDEQGFKEWTSGELWSDKVVDDFNNFGDLITKEIPKCWKKRMEFWTRSEDLGHQAIIRAVNCQDWSEMLKDSKLVSKNSNEELPKSKARRL